MKIKSTPPRSGEIALYRCHQRLSDTPLRMISRVEAAGLVAQHKADWRSRCKAVQLRDDVPRASRTQRGLSATMPAKVTEGVALGHHRDKKLAAAWDPEGVHVENLITTEELAKTLGYTPKRVRQLAEAGLLPGLKLPGAREWRFRPTTIAQLLEDAERHVAPAA